MKAANAERLAE